MISVAMPAWADGTTTPGTPSSSLYNVTTGNQINPLTQTGTCSYQ